MGPTLGGGTQDTDLNKGFTKGMFTNNLRRRNGGCQGDPDPLICSSLLWFAVFWYTQRLIGLHMDSYEFVDLFPIGCLVDLPMRSLKIQR